MACSSGVPSHSGLRRERMETYRNSGVSVAVRVGEWLDENVKVLLTLSNVLRGCLKIVWLHRSVWPLAIGVKWSAPLSPQRETKKLLTNCVRTSVRL